MIKGKPVWVSAGSKIPSWDYYHNYRTGLNFVPRLNRERSKHIPKRRIEIEKHERFMKNLDKVIRDMNWKPRNPSLK